METSAASQLNSSNKPYIILLPLNASSFGEYIILAQAIAQEGTFSPLMVLKTADENWIKRCKDLGLAFYVWQPVPPALPRNLFGKLVGRLLALRPSGVLSWVKNLLQKRHQLQQDQCQAEQLFHCYQPAALVMADDRHLGIATVLFKISRRWACPCLVLPYAEISFQRDIAHSRQQKSIFIAAQPPQRRLKSLLAWFYPQIYTLDPDQIFFYKPDDLLVYASLGLLPATPWLLGKRCDVFGLVGQAAQQLYLDEGGQLEKTQIVGLPSFDDLYLASQKHDQLRATICQKYQCDPSQKIIVCAVPQLGEHQLVDWETHWADTQLLVQQLSQDGTHQVLLSLHPRSDAKQYAFLAECYPVHLLSEPLRDVLPIADIFVATFSSTITWAILLGIPTLLINNHRLFDLKQYDSHQGIQPIYELDTLGKGIQRLMKEETYYQERQHYQRQSAAWIAPFDGQSNQRMIDLIKKYALK